MTFNDNSSVSAVTSSAADALARLAASLGRFKHPRPMLDAFVEGMCSIYGPVCYIELTSVDCTGTFRIVRFRTIDGIEHINSRDPWDGTGLPDQRGGFLGRIVRSSSSHAMTRLEIENDPCVGDLLADYRSAAAVPLYTENAEEFLDWAVLLVKFDDAYNEQTLDAFSLRANLVATMARGLKMRSQLDVAHRGLADAHERIARDVDRIANIQRSLLPADADLGVPGLSVAASYETFDRAGGDMYDLFALSSEVPIEPGGSLSDPRWALLIGDVSGHGPAAAVVMAMFHAILHAYGRRPSGPAELLSHANRLLSVRQVEQAFITAFLAFYDPISRTLTYARAGHPPPLLIDPSGKSRWIEDAAALPLGIDPDAVYLDGSVSLKTGQLLVLYTDGLTEARAPDGSMMESAGLHNATLKACRDGTSPTGLNATRVVRSLRASVQTHEQGGRPTDDQTAVAIVVI